MANRIAHIQKLIRSLSDHQSICILTHSAGGIVASNVYAESNVKKIISFGYPFKHPEREQKAYRTENLKNIDIPMLIIQGNQDEYGGLGVDKQYDLSPQITLFYVNATHEYENLSPDDWQRVVENMTVFCRKKIRREQASCLSVK